jgi:mycothiol synthase
MQRADQMEVRPVLVSDLPQIASLCDRELELDRGAAGYPELLARRPHIGFAVVCDAEVLGVAFGSLMQDAGAGGSIDLIVVDRSFRRQGIGRRLVEQLEREFSRSACGVINVRGNPPCYLWPGVDIHYTPAICFFEDLGFTRGRCVVNMDVDLVNAPLETAAEECRLSTAGIQIRRAEPGDRDALHAWVSSGLSCPGIWAQELDLVWDNPQAGCHLARRGRDIIGFCAYGANQLDIVGPVAVAPASRRLGLATILIKRCLAEQRDRHGLLAAELGWVRPLTLCSDKLQARIGRAFWQYTKPIDIANHAHSV